MILRSGLAPHRRRKNAYLLTVSSDCISVAVSPNPKIQAIPPRRSVSPAEDIQAIPPRLSVSPTEDTVWRYGLEMRHFLSSTRPRSGCSSAAQGVCSECIHLNARSGTVWAPCPSSGHTSHNLIAIAHIVDVRRDRPPVSCVIHLTRNSGAHQYLRWPHRGPHSTQPTAPVRSPCAPLPPHSPPRLCVLSGGGGQVGDTHVGDES